MAKEKTCVMCGCTDSHACPGGCSWVHVFKFGAAGVCSQCAEKFMVLQARSLPETRNLYPVVLYLANSAEAETLAAELQAVNPNLTARRLDQPKRRKS